MSESTAAISTSALSASAIILLRVNSLSTWLNQRSGSFLLNGGRRVIDDVVLSLSDGMFEEGEVMTPREFKLVLINGVVSNSIKFSVLAKLFCDSIGIVYSLKIFEVFSLIESIDNGLTNLDCSFTGFPFGGVRGILADFFV